MQQRQPCQALSRLAPPGADHGERVAAVYRKPAGQPRSAVCAARCRAPAGLLFVALSVLAAAPTQGADLSELVRPPGRFATLDTHRLYYHCVGTGSPRVVIDAGIGGGALEWSAVQAGLAAHTRVCTYDRAGYGWSDPGPSPRTTAREVAELRELLYQAGEAPPYLLVGHSFGGFNMRYFAARHPDDVAGLVLVDSSHPAELPRTTADGGRRMNGIAEASVRAHAASELPYVQASAFLNSRRKAVFAQMDELQHFADSAAEVAATGTLGELPLVVIARDPSAAGAAARETHWRALQTELAALSSHGRLRLATDSGHEVHLARPDVVIDTVRSMLRELARVKGS